GRGGPALPGFSGSGRRGLAYGGRCAAAQHQSQIDQFALPPAPQPAPNLFAESSIWNNPLVKLAPAGISFAVIASRPTPFRQSDKASIIKTHRAAGHSAAETAERQIKKFTLRIAINSPDKADIIAAHIQ